MPLYYYIYTWARFLRDLIWVFQIYLDHFFKPSYVRIQYPNFSNSFGSVWISESELASPNMIRLNSVTNIRLFVPIQNRSSQLPDIRVSDENLNSAFPMYICKKFTGSMILWTICMCSMYQHTTNLNLDSLIYYFPVCGVSKHRFSRSNITSEQSDRHVSSW